MKTIKSFILLHPESDEYTQLREIWLDMLSKNKMPEDIRTLEDIEAMIYLLHFLKNMEDPIVKPLKKLGLIEETTKDVLTKFEKIIMTIAVNDYITKILHNRDKENYRLKGNSLRSYLQHFVSEVRMNGGYVIAKKIYDKCVDMLRKRAERAKESPKVRQLAERYPDIDIHSIVAISVVQGKIELVNDDLDWLEQVIEIAQAKRAE